MDEKRPSFTFSSKKATMGLSKIASMPEIASDQITPPNRSKARLRIKITAEKRQPSNKAPAKQATNPRNFLCFSDRMGGGTGAIFHVSFPFVSLLCSELKDKYS